MLEDDFNDVLNKAIRGQNFDINSLDLDPSQVRDCLNGKINPPIIQALAPALGLDTECLLQLSSYQPAVSIPSAIKTFTSDFGHLGVNAFTIENDTHILIFDTGTNPHECIRYISQFPEKEKHLFITHTHTDHMAGTDALAPLVLTSQLLESGKQLRFGTLTLESLDVAGHCVPATAYFIQGLSTPLCLVGDAIFAGSCGGISPENYKLALRNIHQNILTLPQNTILLNGHGPATTVALEKEHNPFLKPSQKVK